MQTRTSFLCIVILTLGGFLSACNGNSAKAGQATFIPTFVNVSNAYVVDSMPVNAIPVSTGFRDMNVYLSNDYFCIVSIVDNITDNWQQLWVQATILDAQGNTLTVKGDSAILLRTFSDAVPPRGATSLFCAIPLSELSGVPADCKLEGAGSVIKSPGPILIATEIGGVRAMYPDPDDPTKIVERTFQLQATIENPLDLVVQHPRMVVLLYAQDQKLYFAYPVNMDDPNEPFKQEREGPMSPQEKRKITCLIQYDNLPQPLKELLIGRADVQVYEAR